jgi:outer membrane lipoprotein SlyB
MTEHTFFSNGGIMIARRYGIISVALCSILISGCSNDYSGDTYDGHAVGEVSRTDAGTIISMRKIKIKPDSKDLGAGALLGGAGGALAGSMFGGGRGKVLTAGVGAIAGGVAGNAIQNRAQDGFEYTVRLDNGATVTVTQGPSPSLSVGQRVMVINSHKGRSRVVPG